MRTASKIEECSCALEFIDKVLEGKRQFLFQDFNVLRRQAICLRNEKGDVCLQRGGILKSSENLLREKYEWT